MSTGDASPGPSSRNPSPSKGRRSLSLTRTSTGWSPLRSGFWRASGRRRSALKGERGYRSDNDSLDLPDPLRELADDLRRQPRPGEGQSLGRPRPQGPPFPRPADAGAEPVLGPEL